MMNDVRPAVRSLLKTPTFALVTSLTLALGLGATTAVFSVLNAVLLRPLPVRAPEGLVYLRESRLPQFPAFSIAPGNFLAWQRYSRTFDSLAALGTSYLNLTGSGEPERLRADRVTGGLFSLLGVEPVAGRFFTVEDDSPGAEGVLVLSEAMWRGRFGGDVSVLGRALTLSGRPYTVIGVAPQSLMQVVGEAQVWVPMAFDEKEAALHGSHYLRALGRLKAGVTLDAALSDLNRVALDLEREFPGSNDGWRVLVTPIHQFLVRNVRSALLVLAGAVGLVLLIVCANVASLLLARGLSRQKELAVRAALGAGRKRLVREQLVESLVLSAAGGLGGFAVAAALLKGLFVFSPAALPRSGSIDLDLPTVTFAAAIALLAPVVFGLLPALQLSRADLRESLAAGGRSVRHAVRARTRAALVVGQMALALVLLVGCGLLVRSFVRLLAVEPGFEPSNALVIGLQLSPQRYADEAARVAMQKRLMEEIAALPGVRAVGLSQSLPIVNDFVASIELEGRPKVDAADRPTTNFYAVSPGYREAMGIRLLRGRWIAEEDAPRRPRVVVINETFARRFFEGVDAIGQRVLITQGPAEWREIVGVVADTKQYSLKSDTTAQAYESYQQEPFSAVEFVVRGALEPETLTSAIRGAVRRLDPDQPLGRVVTLEQIVDTSLGAERFSLALFGTFAALALFLAALGLYGLVSYMVSQRNLELGVRFALGASRLHVLGLVARQAGSLAVVGILLGTVMAVGASRLMRSLLYGTEANDVVTFAVVPAVLLLVVLLASALPALRAARVDPAVALRGE